MRRKIKGLHASACNPFLFLVPRFVLCNRCVTQISKCSAVYEVAVVVSLASARARFNIRKWRVEYSAASRARAMPGEIGNVVCVRLKKPNQTYRALICSRARVRVLVSKYLASIPSASLLHDAAFYGLGKL